MVLYNPSTLLKPSSVQEAVSLLEKYGSTSRVVAGNTTLYELSKHGGLADVDKLVDLSRLDLGYIQETSNGLRIGATCTFRDMASSELLGEPCYHLLKEVSSKITPPQVRNMGTIGGALCSGVPFYDMPVALLAAGAKIKIVSSHSERVLDISQFFVDYFVTALLPEELLVEVQLDRHKNCVSAFHKLGRTSADFAVVNAAVKLEFNTQTRAIEDARIAVGAISSTPVLVEESQDYLKGKLISEEAISSAAKIASQSIPEPIPSVHASSGYKRRVTRVVVHEALLTAINRLKASGEE